MTSEPLDAFDLLNAQQELAVKYIDMLKATKQASKRVATTYRCRRRCTLLEAYSTVHGVILYFPRYKLSERVNAQDSSEDGRRHNTEDGNRHWKAHAGFFVPDMDYPLHCDHLRSTVSADDLERAVDTGTREVIVNR